MSAGLPELGSKISLISKADIRYEGRLFTLDPQECTIALSAGKKFSLKKITVFQFLQNQCNQVTLFRFSKIIWYRRQRNPLSSTSSKSSLRLHSL